MGESGREKSHLELLRINHRGFSFHSGSIGALESASSGSRRAFSRDMFGRRSGYRKIMRLLPNILVVGWALLVLGSLFLTYTMPAGADPAARAWQRIELFLTWQGTALVIALIAAAFSWARRDPRGSQLWWMGWGPLIGNAFIAAFVGLAVLSARLF